MRTLEFFQLDVFAEKPLTGNPLAVFPDAVGLDDRTMQALAREMNLSETTFVFPSDRATRRVRFFTPTAEVPLVGHPTVGTWWLLAELGELAVEPNETVRVTQETKAGVLPVDIVMASEGPRRVTMTQNTPEFGLTVHDIEELANALGGDEALIARSPAPQLVSTAMPQLIIPIQSMQGLQKLPSGGRGADLADVLRQYGTDCAMCFNQTSKPGVVRCRMFAPGLGVPEDPATGSAAGALGCYLVQHGLAHATDGVLRIVVEQGAEIDRPSRIEVEIHAGVDAAITDVRVGGSAVTVIRGEVRL